MMHHYLSLLLFCFSTSISPGPANLLAMMSGAKFGILKSIPAFLGILIGFNIMVFSVGVGLGSIFNQYPMLHTIIKYIGVAYMLYLAYCIIRSDTVLGAAEEGEKPISFLQAALLQWVNPKGWIMAIGAVSAYALQTAHPIGQAAIISLVFFLVGVPCIGVWLISGAMVRKFLSNQKNMKIFNYITGILLIASILLVLVE
jgi:threonine/homoserine/homoserine lactone efflux protein